MPQPNQTTDMTFAFIVARVHPDIPADRAALSGGLRPLPTGWGLRALAEELVRETRARHTYVGTGRLRCSLWLHHDDEPRPLTRDCEVPPSDADVFEYGDLTA